MGLAGAGHIQRRGNHLGADPTCDRVARTKRVADKQDALRLEVDRGVTAGGDHTGTARHVEDVIGGERLGSL